MATLGIVLPTYNEAANLPRLIDALEGLSLPPELRLFVVDDDSPDGTSRIARELASRYGNISVTTRPGKLGLGSAFRDGMAAALEARCDYVLTMDADLSHDPQDVPRLLEVVDRGGTDVAQASRYAPGGSTRGLSRWRRLKSVIANQAYRRLLGTPNESTTSFRLYSRDSARIIVRHSRARDYEFQPECMLIAMAHRLRVVEVPIVFTEREEGKSKLGFGVDIRWFLFFLWAVMAYRLRIGRFSPTG